jgi:hypothetical protein
MFPECSQVIEMEPLRLAVIALETDSLCDVQRSGECQFTPAPGEFTHVPGESHLQMRAYISRPIH